MEFEDYSKCEWNKEGDTRGQISLKRNFISDVEENDLTEIMCKLDNQIYEEEYHNDGDGELISLKKCMKSLVRIVHRFGYTREHYIPVTKTHQSRDVNSTWSWWKNYEQRRNQIWSYSKCSSTFGWWDFEGFTESTSSSHEQIIHDETLRISLSKENLKMNTSFSCVYKYK